MKSSAKPSQDRRRALREKLALGLAGGAAALLLGFGVTEAQAAEEPGDAAPLSERLERVRGALAVPADLPPSAEGAVPVDHHHHPWNNWNNWSKWNNWHNDWHNWGNHHDGHH